MAVRYKTHQLEHGTLFLAKPSRRKWIFNGSDCVEGYFYVFYDENDYIFCKYRSAKPISEKELRVLVEQKVALI